MRKYFFISIFIISSHLIFGCSKNDNPVQTTNEQSETIVEKYGALKVNGSQIVDKNGNSVSLRGMSLFWSQWGGNYYNAETIEWLRDDWKCTIVRAAMGIENGGYLENPSYELEKVKTVIDACIELGIYVIVDWHDHHAEDHLEEAKSFFNSISAEYGSHPNIIYEIYNEPLNVSWNSVLKPYSEEIINVIRANDPDNLIVVGTSNWSQDVDLVINNKIDSENIAYSFHFYSSTHKKDLMDKAEKAINAGIPIFVTEWGMSEATGDGIIDMVALNEWADFLENYNLSWCNWSITNKDETSAALLPSNQKLSEWNENELSESGKIIRDYLIRENSQIFDERTK